MESNHIALAELLFILGIVLFAVLSQLKSPRPPKKSGPQSSGGDKSSSS
jgi:hypothetical protein